MQTAPFTQRHLKHFLHYEPQTGRFTWARGRRKGLPAGCVQGDRVIKIDLPNYERTRRVCTNIRTLAWLYMTGEWPESPVKHKLKHTLCCKWSQLYTGKLLTRKGPKPKSGERYVVAGLTPGSWELRVPGPEPKKYLYLGVFDTIEAAVIARKAHFQGDLAPKRPKGAHRKTLSGVKQAEIDAFRAWRVSVVSTN